MNPNLSRALRDYSTKEHGEYLQVLCGFSKDALAALFTDLLTLFINDRNSSTLREYITVSVAGYRHSEAKIGYDGYKKTTAEKRIFCEAKPKNVRAADFDDYERGERKSRPRPLNGSGNFTDYTHARLNKDLCAKPQMLVSGFVDGKLLYVLEFPFIADSFVGHLKKQLQKRFPEGDVPNQFLRSADFDYRHYIDCPDKKVVYLAARKTLEDNGRFFNRAFLQKLLAFSR